MKNNYALVIGRFHPPHLGHRKLVMTIIEKGERVLIAIMDTEQDKDNPYSIGQRQQMLGELFKDEMQIGMVQLMVIPAINSVNYGRTVGYEINEIRLDDETESISGTDIRNKK